MSAARRLRDGQADRVAAALARYPDDRRASAVLELMYEAQAAYGHLTAEAIAEVAEIVGVDPTHVRGVAGFYSLLREEPHGGFVLQVCTDLPCALRGSEALLSRLCAILGVEPGGTTDDGLFTVEAVMCLAACDRAPVMQVNLDYYFDLDEPSLRAVLDDLRARAEAGGELRPPFGFGPPSEMPYGLSNRTAASEADGA